jgi:hypothetical protein
LMLHLNIVFTVLQVLMLPQQQQLQHRLIFL